MRPGFRLLLLGIWVAACASGAEASAPTSRVVVKNQGYLPFADAPINYRSSELNDPVAKLEKRLERGAVRLRYESHHGYLKSVLDAVHVPVDSQTLVFSRTSFQFPQITPETPRALYYNDDVYVGQVHDGRFLEFISFDPMQGAIFYVMDEHRDKQPRFERAETDCIQCHVAPSTKGIPGVMLRSVFTRLDGTADAAARSYVTGQESPISQRWGGWYVTAKSGSQGGMANVLISDPQHPEQLNRAAGANLTNLASRFDTSACLAGSSDIVALMVLAHQTQMHNWNSLTNYQTRIAQADPKLSPEEVQRKLEASAEQMIRYLLFANEIPLPNPILGTSDFAKHVASRGPRDSKQRSLRDFDLRTRIFRYPCSNLTYSETFDSFQSPAKEYVYHRLFEVLSAANKALSSRRFPARTAERSSRSWWPRSRACPKNGGNSSGTLIRDSTGAPVRSRPTSNGNYTRKELSCISKVCGESSISQASR
jgi:hypothetical protein